MALIDRILEQARQRPGDEHLQQVAVFAWAGGVPELRWMHAIPNGEKRHQSVANRLKAEGVKAGVHDIFLPLARHGFNGLYLEMKAKDGSMSKAQKEFAAHLDAEGFDWACCKSADEAIARLRLYLEVEDA